MFGLLDFLNIVGVPLLFYFATWRKGYYTSYILYVVFHLSIQFDRYLDYNFFNSDFRIWSFTGFFLLGMVANYIYHKVNKIEEKKTKPLFVVPDKYAILAGYLLIGLIFLSIVYAAYAYLNLWK